MTADHRWVSGQWHPMGVCAARLLRCSLEEDATAACRGPKLDGDIGKKYPDTHVEMQEKPMQDGSSTLPTSTNFDRWAKGMRPLGCKPSTAGIPVKCPSQDEQELAEGSHSRLGHQFLLLGRHTYIGTKTAYPSEAANEGRERARNHGNVSAEALKT